MNYVKKFNKIRMIFMFLPLILLLIIVLLIIIVFIDHRVMQNKLETETYAKDQLVTKISTVTRENTNLKNKMLDIDSNNDTHHHGLRKAKQDLSVILNEQKEQGVIAYFDIIATGNLAVKHPLFEYARAFDYIVFTEKGRLIQQSKLKLIMRIQYIKLLEDILPINFMANTNHLVLQLIHL